jgi:hypothetical protein
MARPRGGTALKRPERLNASTALNSHGIGAHTVVGGGSCRADGGYLLAHACRSLEALPCPIPFVRPQLSLLALLLQPPTLNGEVPTSRSTAYFTATQVRHRQLRVRLASRCPWQESRPASFLHIHSSCHAAVCRQQNLQHVHYRAGFAGHLLLRAANCSIRAGNRISRPYVPGQSRHRVSTGVPSWVSGCCRLLSC